MDYSLGPSSFPYASRRMPVLAPNGVVATSQPLAAQAGLSMLQRGGNAVDAALATAITLTVVEPTSNGIGSDSFALIWDGGTLHGLNGSGRAPAGHTLESFLARDYTAVPTHGWHAVSVPGSPAAWRDLHARFGKLPFDTLFQPAIDYAENGFPLSPVTANAWTLAAERYRAEHSGPEFVGWFDTFAPGGRPPVAGERWSSPGHARTLRRIAETGSAAFYSGELAERMEEFSAKTGGCLCQADLAAHTSTWVEPISTTYRGYDVWEIPPNGQGITALTALNIMEGYDVSGWSRDSVESYHHQIEAMKLAFADAHAYVADMEHGPVPVRGLLDKGYAKERRALIGERALNPAPGRPPMSGTVYLCAADADGMMVSYIQSNYMGFGSGIVVPETGIALQNRGAGFVLTPGHANVLAPGKRPYHTIIPAFLSHGAVPVGPFGVMGGFMQPQGHMQVVVNQVDYGMNPQAALDAPRWRWEVGLHVDVEAATPPALIEGLRARGHEITIGPPGPFGKGQIIHQLSGGGYLAASEPRADGCAVGY